MSKEIMNKLNESAKFLRGKGITDIDVAVILGSGLNDFADRMDDPLVIPYNEIPNMQAGWVSDHRGQLLYGEHKGKKVVLLAGRFHYYECGDMERTAFPARLMAVLGAKRFIITNAAGCVNENYSAGDLMLISDHINYSGANPLIGPNLDELGTRFPDMTYTYDRELREALKEKAHEEGIELREGVYMMFSGPCFETPAEIRFAKTVGADAAGMSTVPEAIIANHARREVIGISFLSNMAAGILDQPLSGAEVTEAAEKVQEKFARVLDMAIEL